MLWSSSYDHVCDFRLLSNAIFVVRWPQTTRWTAWPPANPLAPWGAAASHTPGQVGRPQSLSSATKNFM